jgi:DNA polymerase (family 10)
LQKIEGIGKSTAEKIRELLESGKVERVEALRQKHPRAVVALLQIQGLGPRRSAACAASSASNRWTT